MACWHWARIYDTFPGDQWLMSHVGQWQAGGWEEAAMVLSAAGSGGIGLAGIGILCVPAVVVLGLLGGKRWTDALFLTVAGLAVAVNLGLKELVMRPRPEAAWALVEETGYSFPSGHAVFAAASFGAVMVLMGRWEWLRKRPGVLWGARIVLAALVVGVGTSRVYVGVHWPSDVIMGWLVGALFVALLAYGQGFVTSRGGQGADGGHERLAREGGPGGR